MHTCIPHENVHSYAHFLDACEFILRTYSGNISNPNPLYSGCVSKSCSPYVMYWTYGTSIIQRPL